MSIRFLGWVVTLVGPLIIPYSIAAAPVDDASGSLYVNTFSGKSTPKSTASIFSEHSNDSPLITVATSAARQHSSQPLTNAGASVYRAQAGSLLGDAGQPAIQDPVWNFNDRMNTDNTATALADYHTERPYTIDPAFDDDSIPAKSITATNATLAIPRAIPDPTAAAEAQSSWSLENIASDMQVIDLTGAAWLFGSAMLGLFTVARRKKA